MISRVAHVAILEVDLVHLSEVLGIARAGGGVVAATSELDSGVLRLLIQHPDAPLAWEGGPYPRCTLIETVKTCEHGAVIERTARFEWS